MFDSMILIIFLSKLPLKSLLPLALLALIFVWQNVLLKDSSGMLKTRNVQTQITEIPLGWNCGSRGGRRDTRYIRSNGRHYVLKLRNGLLNASLEDKDHKEV